MEPDFELAITLPAADSRQLLRAFHGQLKGAILDGRLRSGLRMPATRALAALYGVSRNTAVAAYDLLLSEGYLQTRPRGGTYVAETLPQAPARTPAKVQGAGGDRRLTAFWRVPPPIEAHAAGAALPRFDFKLGVPDEGALRFDLWQRLAARSLRAMSRETPSYSQAEGRPALREAIARHTSFARAVACSADDVVVTSGIQQALDLLARILVTPGKTVVAVEDPGYPPMRAAFAAAGALVAPVPVDAEGLIVERLPANAKIIYVTPSHQFPLGCVMSMRRRGALLEFAERHGAVILEDDYDGEFRYGERPLDALQTLDRGESVFYLGTFSKSLFPALRLGFVAAPRWARDALAAAKQCADWHCPVPLQDTLAAFIAEGHLARHVRKMRAVYGERRELLLSHLRRDFDDLLTPVDSSAGLHLAAFAAPSLDIRALTLAARAADVGIYALHPYYAARRGKPGLAFGFGAMGAAAIAEGMARLARLAKRR